MKKMLFSSLLVASLLSPALMAKDYMFDKTHTDVGFKIKHLQINNIKGNFKGYDAVADFDPATYEFKKFETRIKVASMDADGKAGDNHLLQDDFFKVKSHPEMSFMIRRYEKTSDSEGKVDDTLAIAGVSKDIVSDAEIGGIAKGKDGREKVDFTLESEIKRSDFKFVSSTPNLTLDDEVKISVEIETNEK